jgi:hypothetical protein
MVYRSTMTRPGGSRVGTGMEVAFQQDNGGTRLTILQPGVVAVDGRGKSTGNWAGILGRLGGLGRVIAAVVTGRDGP